MKTQVAHHGSAPSDLKNPRTDKATNEVQALILDRAQTTTRACASSSDQPQRSL